MTRNSAHKNSSTIKQALLVFALTFMSFFIHAENLKKIVNLEGSWKFTVGDDPAWSAPDYDDQDWDFVSAPRSWESNGFVDYNGFAWYRKEFKIDQNLKGKAPFLILGFIDDVDEVYLNGVLIGACGAMPPNVVTSHSTLRKYPLPTELLKLQGENSIAVRVFDEYNQGGIYAGPLGIFYDIDNDLLAVNLAGYWDFEPRFKYDEIDKLVYNQKKNQIYVPAYWESFGYDNLDGTATYSRTFNITNPIDDQNMLLVLGYIDDLDKVFINDVAITLIDEQKKQYKNTDFKDVVFRAYKIPPGVLNLNDTNYIEVIVTDTGGLGGIYEGPIGLVTAENYNSLNKNRSQKPFDLWENVLKDIFEWD